MKQFSVKYTRIPTNYHDTEALLVEAETADDARELVRQRLGEDRGVHNYDIQAPREYVRKQVQGRILGKQTEEQ